MLFLLTVVLVALKWGRGPAVLAAFVSVATFDFFFVAAAVLVRGQRHPVPADVCRHAGRRADHRPDDRRACATRRASRPTARSAPASLYEFARDMSSKLLTADVVDVGDADHRQHVSREGRDPGARRPGPAPARRRRATATGASTSAPRSGRTTRRSRPAPAPTRSPAASSSTCRCGRRCARAACWRSSPTTAAAARARAAPAARHVRGADRHRAGARALRRGRAAGADQHGVRAVAQFAARRRCRTTCARRLPRWSDWPSRWR